MTAASHLQPTREYLLWWETHRDRWVAAPVVRSGPILVDIDYPGGVTVHPAAGTDTGGPCPNSTR